MIKPPFPTRHRSPRSSGIDFRRSLPHRVSNFVRRGGRVSPSPLALPVMPIPSFVLSSYQPLATSHSPLRPDNKLMLTLSERQNSAFSQHSQNGNFPFFPSSVGRFSIFVFRFSFFVFCLSNFVPPQRDRFSIFVFRLQSLLATRHSPLPLPPPSPGPENASYKRGLLSSSRRCVICSMVSGNLGRPGETAYDPMHICVLPFALLFVSWDVSPGCQKSAAARPTPSP